MYTKRRSTIAHPDDGGGEDEMSEITNCVTKRVEASQKEVFKVLHHEDGLVAKGRGKVYSWEYAQTSIVNTRNKYDANAALSDDNTSKAAGELPRQLKHIKLITDRREPNKAEPSDFLTSQSNDELKSCLVTNDEKQPWVSVGAATTLAKGLLDRKEADDEQINNMFDFSPLFADEGWVKRDWALDVEDFCSQGETDVQKCDAAVKEESELEVCELLPSDDLFYPINNRGYDLDVPCLLGERATEGEYSGGLRESSDPGTTKANLPLCHMTWTRKELRVDVTSEPYILDSTVAQPRSQNYSDFVCVIPRLVGARRRAALLVIFIITSMPVLGFEGLVVENGYNVSLFIHPSDGKWQPLKLPLKFTDNTVETFNVTTSQDLPMTNKNGPNLRIHRIWILTEIQRHSKLLSNLESSTFTSDFDFFFYGSVIVEEITISSSYLARPENELLSNLESSNFTSDFDFFFYGSVIVEEIPISRSYLARPENELIPLLSKLRLQIKQSGTAWFLVCHRHELSISLLGTGIRSWSIRKHKQTSFSVPHVYHNCSMLKPIDYTSVTENTETQLLFVKWCGTYFGHKTSDRDVERSTSARKRKSKQLTPHKAYILHDRRNITQQLSELLTPKPESCQEELLPLSIAIFVTCLVLLIPSAYGNHCRMSLEAEEDKLGIDIAQTNTQKDKLDIDIAQTNTQTHGSLPNASFALEADESLKENSTEDNVVAKGSLRNDSLKDMPTITSLDTEYLTEQFAYYIWLLVAGLKLCNHTNKVNLKMPFYSPRIRNLPDNLQTSNPQPLPAARDESKEHFTRHESTDWQNFSQKSVYSSDLDRPFQLPCYNSACEGKAVGAGLAHDTDELQEILKGLNSNYEYLRPPPTEILCYTIPRYPDNHNPLLPLALQKKLDEMAPREFLTYVLKELTLEERESLMVDERQRRKSFLVNWPHSNNLSGVKLAQAGFYCVDNYDRVQCVFCRGSLHHWERDDNPMTEHARSFNFCRFVKGLECGNREYKSDVLTAEELKNINFYGDPPEMKKNRDGSVSTDSRSLGISTNRADTIQYAPEASRLRTYARWPASSPVTARTLCEAGFYFTGFDDQVRCFYCSGGLRSWQTSDDPWEEHARWFPECSFLLQQKGEDYVTEVHNRTPANKKCTRSTESQKREEKKTKQDQSNYQAMVEFCIKMGHSETVIREAVRRNGRRFSNPDAFLDAIYNLDDPDSGFQEGDDSMDYSVMPAGAAGKLTNQPVSVPEEDARRYRSGEMQTDGAYSGLLDATSNNRKCPPACCIMCFRKANIIETATQLGLPCGHVIYCDRCSKEERTRTNVNKHYKSKCPYFNCGAPLTGTFKFYIN